MEEVLKCYIDQVRDVHKKNRPGIITLGGTMIVRKPDLSR